jgi:hypothetical protein
LAGAGGQAGVCEGVVEVSAVYAAGNDRRVPGVTYKTATSVSGQDSVAVGYISTVKCGCTDRAIPNVSSVARARDEACVCECIGKEAAVDAAGHNS